MRILITYLMLALLVSGCSNYILIERSKDFSQSALANAKIYCIDPEVRIYGLDQRIIRKESEEMEVLLQKEIKYAADRLGYDLEILQLDATANTSFYNELLALKQEFLQSNNYQNTPLNFRNRPGVNRIDQSVFVYPPLIAHDFTNLSEEYGTPYFSYIGIYRVRGKVLLYHLIVNTDTAETVYREVKSVPKSAVKKKLLGQMVYDSIAMLKKGGS